MGTRVDVVVARYNEDIRWTQRVNYNVIIYNKGASLPNSIDLPNIGRESHTYLEHILRNYDHLDREGITVFCQGRISDMIRNKPPHAYVYELANEAREKGFSVSKARWHDLIRPYLPLENFRIREWPRGSLVTPNERNETYGQWFRRCLQMDHLPDKSQFKWILGAVFAVHNKKILSRSKEFYASLLQELKTETNPEVGHFFERSWYYIFNAHVN